MMEHLDSKDLSRLAQQAVRGADPAPRDKERIAHIRQCRDCYRRFAVMAQLFARLGTVEEEPVSRRVLGAVRLTVEQTGERLCAAFHRVEQAAAEITFVVPQGALAPARGGARPRTVVRVDGTETEEDLITYDTARRVLTVQLSLDQHPGLRARAEVHTRDGRCIPLPLTEEDGVLYGTLEEFAEPDAEICLLAE